LSLSIFLERFRNITEHKAILRWLKPSRKKKSISESIHNFFLKSISQIGSRGLRKRIFCQLLESTRRIIHEAMREYIRYINHSLSNASTA